MRLSTCSLLGGVLLASFSGAAFSGAAWAQDFSYSNSDDTAVLSGGVGVLALEGNEYVYQSSGSDDLLSKLVWQSTAPVATANLDFSLGDGWTLKLNGQAAMSGDSYMEDTDWSAPYATGYGEDDWSDKSQHENTDLDWYFQGSVALGKDVYKQDGLSVNVNAGLQYTDVQWTGNDGTYVYSQSGFRDSSGSFSGKVISYRQQYPVAFTGVDMTMQQGNWTFGLGGQAGVAFGASSTDNHYLRDLVISDDFEAAPMIGASVKADYKLSDGLAVEAAAKAQTIFNLRGDSTYDYTSGSSTSYSDIGGADLTSAVFTLGLNGRF